MAQTFCTKCGAPLQQGHARCPSCASSRYAAPNAVTAFLAPTSEKLGTPTATSSAIDESQVLFESVKPILRERVAVRTRPTRDPLVVAPLPRRTIRTWQSTEAEKMVVINSQVIFLKDGKIRVTLPLSRPHRIVVSERRHRLLPTREKGCASVIGYFVYWLLF